MEKINDGVVLKSISKECLGPTRGLGLEDTGLISENHYFFDMFSHKLQLISFNL